MGKANQLAKHKRLISSYLAKGLNYRAIYLLLKGKLDYEMTYGGVRAWIVANIPSKKSVSHEKRHD